MTLTPGFAAPAMRMMWECGLLQHVMPTHAKYIKHELALGLNASPRALFYRDPLFRCLAGGFLRTRTRPKVNILLRLSASV